MPPYTPNRSKAQQRKMFALAARGELSQADAEGKARASHYASLPEHVKTSAIAGVKRAIHHQGKG